MTDDDPAPQISSIVKQMLAVVPAEQMDQLAECVLACYGYGWAKLEIIFEDSHIKNFYPAQNIRSKKPANKAVNHLQFSQDTV